MINIINFLSDKIKNVNTEIKLDELCIVQSKIKDYDYTINYLLKDYDNINKLKQDYGEFQIEKTNKFFNIKLKKSYVSELFNNILNLDSENLIQKSDNKEKIIIDYSSPNVAKEMHIGHLRSTIIGDTLSNFYELLGHDVLRINHIGDFGLQFGMMINYIIKNNLKELIDNLDLQDIYVEANKLANSDENFNNESQVKTYELQNKIEPSISIHKKICEKSRQHFEKNYSILNITKMIEIGESFYQNYIPNMIIEFDSNNILEENEGRKIIRTSIKNTNSKLTVIKSNGGYTYDTTDLCALKYRIYVQKADKIFYVVDSGQSDHFEQIFEIGKRVGWIKEQEIKHINFGLVLGEDGKRIRSRDGGSLKLLELFDETINQTEKVLLKKNSLISKETIINLAIGSIKYADLKSDRRLNYKFSFSKMLNFTGNTLCYIMYCHVRSKKVINNYLNNCEKINKFIDPNELNDIDFKVIILILKFPEYINKTLITNEINHLTTYLYELSELVHIEYKNNRVIDFDLKTNKLIKSNNSRINIFVMSNQIFLIIFKILNIIPIDSM
jgi:arginyl-tRNA synthetase